MTSYSEFAGSAKDQYLRFFHTPNPVTELRRSVAYRFESHFHPFASEQAKEFIRLGVDGAMGADDSWDLDLYDAGDIIVLEAGSFKTQDGQVRQLRGRTISPPLPAPNTGGALELLVEIAAGSIVRDTNRGRREVANKFNATIRSHQPRPRFHRDDFVSEYKPSAAVDTEARPIHQLHFGVTDAYAAYNWETYFHVPFLVATTLSRNGRHADAARWFHFIFDPTSATNAPSPEKFWKFRPFKDLDPIGPDAVVRSLTDPAPPPDDSVTDPALRARLLQQHEHDVAIQVAAQAWAKQPFRPHLVARYRPAVYMTRTVMSYLDNLIAWGDSLFQQDTGEAIDEATQLYLLAAQLLGTKPQAIPRNPDSAAAMSYADLRRRKQQALSDIEDQLAIGDVLPAPASVGSSARRGTVASIGAYADPQNDFAAYFCVPHNEQLLEYWNTVADRLFKIRNSLNLDGAFRQLPLFQPPIDPGLLVRAAAAGVDIGAAIAGLDTPSSQLRFNVLIQKAGELAAEVRSLGSALLQAMEREDSERLTVLRAEHEESIMGLTQVIRFGQKVDAEQSREAAEVALINAIARYSYYELQLGADPSKIVEPILRRLGFKSEEQAALDEMTLKLSEELSPRRPIVPDIASSDDVGESKGQIISSFEQRELDKMDTARTWHTVVGTSNAVATAFAPVPDSEGKIHYWGLGTSIELPGGTQLSRVASLARDGFQILVDKGNYEAGMIGRAGGFARREQEWAFQSNVAAGEIDQFVKQLRSAQIREELAKRELKLFEKQIDQAKAIKTFLNADGANKREKKANLAVYSWLLSETRALHRRAYDLAIDIARKAERALQFELGDHSASFIKPDYRGGNEGLLAGERLALDLKRMDLAYLEQNQREFELTRHFSLREFDPVAFVNFRDTGKCNFTIPEWFFDLDTPGHYFRRIRSIAVTIPCVVGPYASMTCTLTLTGSKIRVRPDVAEDAVIALPGTGSIVTSTAVNDTGLFDPAGSDGRRVPFELQGCADSTWQLERPTGPQLIDPKSIVDVILHIRYTSRLDRVFEQPAIASRANYLEEATVLVDLAQSFPNEWAARDRGEKTTVRIDFGSWSPPLHLGPRSNWTLAWTPVPPRMEPPSQVIEPTPVVQHGETVLTLGSGSSEVHVLLSRES